MAVASIVMFSYFLWRVRCGVIVSMADFVVSGSVDRVGGRCSGFRGVMKVGSGIGVAGNEERVGELMLLL